MKNRNYFNFCFNYIIFRYCYETNYGKMILPLSLDDLNYHIGNFGHVFMEKALPSTTTWIAYFSFFVFQIILASFMPGLTMYGLPTAPNGVRLPYHCNGYSCYYFCLFSLFILHYTGLFPITHVCDHYGEYLFAAVSIADVTTVLWYIYGLVTTPKDQQSLTGYPIYDFFMGTVLYPRIGEVDIKMVAEARWSWLTLIVATLSCAVKQYEQAGYLTKEMAFMVLAHWLYSNATVKGEHCITCTWDMFHEKFGWMLNFWNIAGVPYLYCYQSFYILKNYKDLDASQSVNYVAFLYVFLIFAYYVFDSSNCQKASYKIKIKRNTFPQVPWGVLEEPIKVIKTPHGNLLIDGWYAYARKAQYTGDIMMALSWGLITGFGSSLNYFYCFFFTSMIIHRQTRDEERCKEKYGKYWDEYVKTVPNVFIPNPKIIVDFFNYLMGNKSKSE